MDASEKVVANFLAHHGYIDVVYEPDGGVPPDFLVEGRIAVEVRRLNENYEVGTGHQGLEEIEIPLWQGVRSLASSFGPPTHGSSWFVFFRFRRPVEPWKKLKPKLRAALEAFVNTTSPQKASVELGNRFELEIFRASNLRATFFVIAGCSDNESGGLLVEDMARNLQICISEKTKKTANVRSKYPEWWLVFVDHIAYGCLNDFDRRQLQEQAFLKHDWKKIILVDPQDHRRAFEI